MTSHSKCRIFGLQRSGTNFLEQILLQNVKNITVQTNSKHSLVLPADVSRTLTTFVIYKNPYTWIESICFRNKVDWIKKSSIENSSMLHLYPALEKTETRYTVGRHKINLINLCKAYSHFHKTWISADLDQVYFVKYEDLLSSNKMFTIEKMLTFVGSDTKNIKIPQRGKVSQSKTYSEHHENYYKTMKPKYLTDIQIQKINECIDNDIFDFLGYTK